MAHLHIRNGNGETVHLELKFGWDILDPSDPALCDHMEISLGAGDTYLLLRSGHQNMCFFKSIYDPHWQRTELFVDNIDPMDPGKEIYPETDSVLYGGPDLAPMRLHALKGPILRRIQLGSNVWGLSLGGPPRGGGFLLWHMKDPHADPDDPKTQWSKVMWNATEQMDLWDIAGALNENGVPFLVVVGGDNRLLFRIGPATNSFSSPESGYFSWPDPNTPIMDARSIVSVSRDAQGLIRIIVIGGDGKTCEISQIKKNRAVFSGWTCR
jgi:hypothetical protein